jgi:hypothetical protein
MTEQLHNLIESLREELRHYGELLALLETEHGQAERRQHDELLATVQAINSQGEALQGVQRERAQRQRDLAQSLEMPPDARIASLLPLLPKAQRSLLQALVEESGQLLVRVRQRARQHHLLLSRSLELMEKFLNSLCGLGVATTNQPQHERR